MERVDLSSRRCDERDVDGTACRSLEHYEVGELGSAVGLPERRDCERRENRPVETDARRRIGDIDLHVVEDDARPIPVDHGGDFSEAANA
jgi:hypothetical protein